MESLPIIEMASQKKSPDKTGKPENIEKSKKTPEQAREVYEKRFHSLTLSIQSQIDEYKTKLQDESFEDKDGEVEGSGEKRKEEMQKSITKAMEKVESMKVVLDSGEEIPNVSNEIQVDYTYINPDTKKVERQETINLDIEKKLEEFIEFYKQNNIDLPPTFEDDIKEIWTKNADEIQKTIEENGFDEILIIPEKLDTVEISKKMKMENGYYDYIKSNKTVADLDGIPLVSNDIGKNRIILVHKAQNLSDYPELAKTKGKEAQELDAVHSLSLGDYIVFQNKYNKETNKHLDEDGWTWLLRTKSGSRFVDSRWAPSGGKLCVGADDAGSPGSTLGSRVSRYFF